MITNSLVPTEKLTTKERWLVVYCVLNINAETEWGWALRPGPAPMPNENLSGEREWTPATRQRRGTGEQGEARRLRYFCLKVKENVPSLRNIALLTV